MACFRQLVGDSPGQRRMPEGMYGSVASKRIDISVAYGHKANSVSGVAICCKLTQ